MRTRIFLALLLPLCSSAPHDASIGDQVHEHTGHADVAEVELLFKMIDIDQDGIMDAKELIRVCLENNIDITETEAELTVTLPDKSVGLSMDKFAVLLADCPSSDTVDMLNFLIHAASNVKREGKTYGFGFGQFTKWKGKVLEAFKVPLINPSVFKTPNINEEANINEEVFKNPNIIQEILKNPNIIQEILKNPNIIPEVLKTHNNNEEDFKAVLQKLGVGDEDFKAVLQKLDVNEEDFKTVLQKLDPKNKKIERENNEIKQDKLYIGEKLSAGEFLRSDNEKYDFVVQKDGNMVVYQNHNENVLWNSDTKIPGSILVFQEDGNLVLSKDDIAVWSSGTQYKAGEPEETYAQALVMQGDGILVLYSKAGNVLWASNQESPNTGTSDTGDTGTSDQTLPLGFIPGLPSDYTKDLGQIPGLLNDLLTDKPKQICTADAVNTDACLCTNDKKRGLQDIEVQVCSAGEGCNSDGTCLSVCTVDAVTPAACFCANANAQGGQACTAGQGCNAYGTCLDVCTADAVNYYDACFCGGAQGGETCTAGQGCNSLLTCLNVCTADAVNRDYDACFCGNGQGGEACAFGKGCSVDGTCLNVCTADAVNLDVCFCKNAEGGDACTAGQGCAADGTCFDVCTGEAVNYDACFCGNAQGGETCIAGQGCCSYTSTCKNVCTADAVNLNQDGCFCENGQGGEVCTFGKGCSSSGSCLTECTVGIATSDDCFCKSPTSNSGDVCTATQTCATDGTCVAVCAADEVNPEACFCQNAGGGEVCFAGQACNFEKSCLDVCTENVDTRVCTVNVETSVDCFCKSQTSNSGEACSATQACFQAGTCTLPRQQNIQDLGYGDFISGWYDVQGQGVNSDYCRWVGNCGCRGSCSWWSCAVAGTTNTYTPKGRYSQPVFPRQQNIHDLGYVDCLSGWYDVQKQGVNNDFCRWVGDCGCRGGCSWWSCALAGTNAPYSPKGKYSEPVCASNALNPDDCLCQNNQGGGGSCTAGQLCKSDGTCHSVCTPDAVNTNACLCEGGETCSAGQGCNSDKTCLNVCPPDTVNSGACFCEKPQGGGEACTGGQLCNTDGTCHKVCTINVATSGDCLCKPPGTSGKVCKDTEACAQDGTCVAGSHPGGKCFPATGNQMVFYDIGMNKFGQNDKPEWIFSQQGTKVSMLKNTRPSVGVTDVGDPTKAVSFTGKFYSTNSDGDVVGMVFGFKDAKNFFVVASVQDPPGPVNWWVGRVHATCSNCAQSTTISNAIWKPSTDPSEVTVIKYGTDHWRRNNHYRFSICYDPVKQLLQVTIINESDGDKVVLETGRMSAATGKTNVDNQSKLGGYMGIYADSQKDSHWEELQCGACIL